MTNFSRTRLWTVPLIVAVCCVSDMSGPRITAAQTSAEAADSLDVPPVLTEQAQARLQSAIRTAYPRLLWDAGVTGTSSAHFEVQADGTVRRASIHVAGATHELFGTSIRSLLGRLQFVPARRNGEAVAAWMEATVDWRRERNSHVAFRPAPAP
jgi:Gram-negative bacterial TonB protein C-terminal